MLTLKRARVFAVVTVFAGTSLLHVAAQSPSPAPSGAPPASNAPAGELPKSGPLGRSAAPAQNPLIGLAVFSSDGDRLGTVDSVDGEPDGKISAINLRTGGFLGFGTRVVAIPEGKFQRVGQFVKLVMTTEDVGKLPALKDRT
jgi:sporulation protein YlmC with PRC-barrel domain